MGKTKIYISGPITGVPDAKTKFDKAKEELSGEYEPVSPFDNGLADDATWNDHMIADIRMLMDCDAMYMLPGWMSSKGARIEFRIAEEMKKNIIFATYKEHQKNVNVKNDRFAAMVMAAIRETMGTTFSQYDDDTKSRNVFFMRMIFTHHCREYGMTLVQIKAYTHRDHTTMLHYLKQYKVECKYNSEFRNIAAGVSKLLSTFVSE